MRGAVALRGFGVMCALAVSAVLPTRSAAFEFFDGRLEIHGFYEAQIRTIATDFHFGDADMTQWWNILNFEIEADIAPDGFGPFDLVTAFARVEVRYDCIWTSACSAFDNAASYAKNANWAPRRLQDSRRTGYASSGYFRGDVRDYTNQENTMPVLRSGYLPDGVPLQPNSSRRYFDEIRKTPAFAGLWNSTAAVGFDGKSDSGDEPGLVYFADYQPPIPGGSHFRNSFDCDRWGSRMIRSTAGGFGPETLPLEPECRIFAIGTNADKPNPLDPRDQNFFAPINGSGAKPYLPAPELASDANTGDRDVPVSRGLYYPSIRLRELLTNEKLAEDSIDSQLSRSRLAWNHGASQENENELKELYFDIEMFDSRLWLRVGFQTIVWGKTELFRNQDQFNPQDLALASLPSLEESRISLWAVRGVWSFYDVGPLQDVRVELAANIDAYQPNDFGICGEPYTIVAVCGFRSGTLAHGHTGVGLVGLVPPESGWQSLKGVEVGGRVEWRWDRFSFAITDFYGFQDFPWLERLFTYSRNVDPLTGRPREAESRGSCKTGRNHACLTPSEAVSKHSINQQLFGLICAQTLPAAPNTDPTACLSNVWASQATTTQPSGAPGPFVVVAINNMLAGDTPDQLILGGAGDFTDRTFAEIDRYVVVERADAPLPGFKTVTVPLNRDINDGPVDHPADHPLQANPEFQARAVFFNVGLGLSLSDKLTDHQEALLGCGAFYQTTCDLDGIELGNAEASALYSAWPVANGTGGDILWDTTDASNIQPGTLGWQGEARCTRFQNGQTFVLPGCRGPQDSGYDVREDGTSRNLKHPFTGQTFRSEITALSWNFMMLLVGNSLPPAPEGQLVNDSGSNRIEPDSSRFIPDDAFRKGGCGFRHPQLCSSVKGLIDLTGLGPNQIRAGGNGVYGRRDYVWHGGGELVARAQKKNILGFSMDFAEDFTKSNWGVEFTWVSDLIVGNNQSFDGVDTSDFYRLTISVDRPTFVNFLNANRTFFFNTQWFISYGDDYVKGFTTSRHPWQVFFVVAISTGYFQDRLLTSANVVYFFDNHSMAFLPQVTYRFTENFSATFGIALFSGRYDLREGSVNPVAPPTTRVGRTAYSDFSQYGLSAVRERDEFFFRIKYTF